ncbi:molybdenum cofactor biosynthesis bifunctional protein [Sphingobacterium faecium NBRC 15299]|uniref:bifunctional molybdenum cofactor biosynthesis protein MoaC/MoaB n=1 Tax=Sphingobacterium faecium TaxID=34087 RepID=UPI000D35594F|nr:bifunctional molybdenum cofactor biosynthesis protein MoaC/MoaB [Sphingobacterium faecium]PTX09692.1 cyclic pyranopterin monophosphate synthase subunit MoaC [Sphingobacterium faecium]GEM63692.1 molybdenum cofactor biosynthesis bifunctional protein [Sphingobacterium faecium NBRC 15299]
MVDITHKSYTLRKAIATAVVVTSNGRTVDAIKNGQVPKGNVYEFARAATLLAIKKTSDLIPDCHPLPIEYAAVDFEIEGLTIVISVTVHTIYKTGVEVEAMHGASVAALVLYDMLKPIDKNVEIGSIRLLHKSGGKSDQVHLAENRKIRAVVVVCSDSVYSGEKQDRSGLILKELLEEHDVEVVKLDVVPDEVDAIQDQLNAAQGLGVDMLIYTGGTGVSNRDVTPDAVLPFLTKQLPGVMEVARQYGQQFVKTAMLSRAVAGFAGNMLVLTLPGSTNGVKESMRALFPQILHVFPVKDNQGHG